jgi:hypothetical protein
MQPKIRHSGVRADLCLGDISSGFSLSDIICDFSWPLLGSGTYRNNGLTEVSETCYILSNTLIQVIDTSTTF